MWRRNHIIGYVQLLTAKRVMNHMTLINQSLREEEGKDSNASIWNVLYDFINEIQGKIVIVS